MPQATIAPSDHQEIADLLVDYCRHLDRMDLEALGALFTKDCDVVYRDAEAFKAKGRAALESSLTRMWRWRRTAHHLSNIRIWPNGENEARAESYVYAWHERDDGGTAIVLGRYLDQLVKTADGWRIAHRRMDMNGSDEHFRIPLPQAPRKKPPPDWQPPEGLDD